MKKLLSFFMVSLLLLAGCQKTPEDSAKPTDTNNTVSTGFEGNYVVNVDYVKAHMGDKDFLAVDTRGEKAAMEGTLEGAIAVAWQQFADVSNGKPGDAMWGTVLPADKLSEALAATGISKDKNIVLFADSVNGWGEDGRILWMLAMAGYENVKVLDGGFEAIVKSGLSIKKGEVAPYVPADVKIEAMDYKTNIDTEELVKKIAENPELKIIDTRNADEYQGATKYGEAKGGHIPKAININFTEFMNNGYLKTNDEIVKLLEDKGIKKDDEIVTYCTAGIRSAHMQKILEMCGFTNVRNYDESYYRWSATNEVEK
ncbi:MAG: sulfurtransferase [Filifactoraceae bacterium]